MDVNTITMDTIAVQLDQAVVDLIRVRTRLEAELAPLLARDTQWVVCQERHPTEGLLIGAQRNRNALRLFRNGGDLILRRGALVGARLSLTTLLTEADLYPRSTAGSSECTGVDICAFFSKVCSRPLASVMVRAYEGTPYNYDIIDLPGLYGRTGGEHAQRLLDQALGHDAVKKITDARTALQAFAEKRKRVEAYEQEWVEDPRLAKRLRKTAVPQ